MMRISKLKTEKKVRTIVFSFDEKYAKYFSVVLISLIRYADKDYVYDLIVLYDSLSNQTIKRLKKMVPNGFTLRFFDVGEYAFKHLGDLSCSTVEGKWVISTFYDLLIPLIMPDYEYVLYCDSDIVFQDDPGKLFETPLNGRPLAAVQDAFSLSFALNPENEFAQNQDVFLREKLEVTNPKNYFNTGVLLFHIPSVDKEEYLNRVRTAFTFPELPTVDQDVLNYVFKGNAKLAPLHFNLQVSVLSQLKKNIVAVQTNPEAAALLEASKAPVIIHYTTEKKPWRFPDCELGDRFWKEARRSPFYKQILHENNIAKPQKSILYSVKNLLVSVYRKVHKANADAVDGEQSKNKDG